MTFNEVFDNNEVHFTATLVEEDDFSVDFEGAFILPVDEYTGDYEITPTTSVQILLTQDKITTQNITVNPIPSSYGLVTWNGSYLTIL